MVATRNLKTRSAPVSAAVPQPHPFVLKLPADDNTPQGLEALLKANRRLREMPWPAPFDETTHCLRLGDARDLSWLPDNSVHLVVTSPPYWTLKQYRKGCPGQLGDVVDYEAFLDALDKVWRECARVLFGGGRICW